MEKLEKKLDDVVEMVTFLKDSAITRNEFQGALLGMREEISGAIKESEDRIKTEVMTHIDTFIALHQKLDLELVALRAKYQRLEEEHQKLKTQMGVIMKHLQMEPA